MQKAMGHILKGDEVKLEGRLCLDAARAEPNLSKGGSPASAAQQVRIVENHPEFAVIEVTCSCGKRTYLRCEYAGAKSSVEDSGPVPQ